MAPKSRLAGNRSRFPFPSAELEAADSKIDRIDLQSEFLRGMIFGVTFILASIALASLVDAVWRLAA